MTLTRIKTMATTRRIWIKPPIVVLVTSPSTQRINRITQIVHNIYFLSHLDFEIHRRLMRSRTSRQRFSSLVELGHSLFDGDVIFDLSHALDFFGGFPGGALLSFGVDE